MPVSEKSTGLMDLRSELHVVDKKVGSRYRNLEARIPDFVRKAEDDFGWSELMSIPPYRHSILEAFVSGLMTRK